MRKKEIDPAHLLVILNRQEAEIFGLDTAANWGSPACRLAVARLFAAASEGTGLAHVRRQITIRAAQAEDGRLVLLFSTAFPVKGKLPGGRRVFRVKDPPGPYVYGFADAGDLLDALAQLSRTGAGGRGLRLVQWKNGYRLLLPFPLHSAARAVLTEYGRLCGRGSGAAAYTLEHGKLLSSDAVREIGAKLSGGALL